MDRIRNLNLPKIASLQVPRLSWEQASAIASWEMPALRHLVVQDSEARSILQRFGPQILCLELHGFREVIKTVRLAPHLRELVISLDTKTGYPHFGPPGDTGGDHPSLTHLGIAGCANPKVLKAFLEGFPQAGWPALRCVRLSESPLQVESTGSLRERCKQAGVAIEDEYGNDVFSESL